MLAAAGIVDREWSAGWRPEPIRTVSDWADEKRRLAPEGSSEPGPWRTSRTPYLREIMDVLSPHHPAQEIVFMSSSQVGKTEVGLNWIGSTIEWDPAPMLAVQPTTNVAKRWSKQRLAGMIRETVTLRAIVRPSKSRDSGNTTLMKEFPGGVLIAGGANSAADLASMPIKKLFLDEVDRYPQELGNIGEEGDPVELAIRRTATYPRRKIFKCSSPTIESLSRINRDWEISDQRRYYVACPHCAEYQVLRWDNLRWTEGKPETAAYICELHGCVIEEHAKTAMLEGGQWRATYPGRSVIGFHLNALYTPIGLGDSWPSHAGKWERIRNDPAKVKVFRNTVLGECHKDPNEKLDWKQLKDRASMRAVRTIPKGCLVITAGVDVQGNRLAIQLIGWGREQRAWVLDWLEIPGDPTQQDVWNKLDEYLLQPMMNAFDVPLRVTAAAVDAGYLPDAVLKYTRTRRHRNVFAVKGLDSASRSILSTATKPDKNKRGRTSKRSADLWLVSSSAAKEMLFLRVQADAERADEDRMVHFPADLGEEYYTQFTAEIYDPKTRKWVKQQARNEALDTAVYALAATYHPNIRLHVLRESDWLKIESVLEPQVRDLFTAAPAAATPAAPQPDPPERPAEQPAQAAPQPRAKPDWVPRRNNWIRKK